MVNCCYIKLRNMYTVQYTNIAVLLGMYVLIMIYISR